MLSSASASPAITVPTGVVFSARLNIASDVNLGGAFPLTVMSTASRSRPPRPSMTVTWKVSVAALDGAVKVGLAAVGLLNVTSAPAVCAQR